MHTASRVTLHPSPPTPRHQLLRHPAVGPTQAAPGRPVAALGAHGPRQPSVGAPGPAPGANRRKLPPGPARHCAAQRQRCVERPAQHQHRHADTRLAQADAAGGGPLGVHQACRWLGLAASRVHCQPAIQALCSAHWPHGHRQALPAANLGSSPRTCPACCPPPLLQGKAKDPSTGATNTGSLAVQFEVSGDLRPSPTERYWAAPFAWRGQSVWPCIHVPVSSRSLP